MDRNINIAVNIFVVRSNKILLGKRNGGFGDGEWAIPGGHLENRERLTDTARRELLEETGMSAKDFVFKHVINLTNSNKHYIYFGFQAVDPIGEPQLREPDHCYEWKWFDMDSLPDNFISSQMEHIHLLKEDGLLSDGK